MADSYYSNIKKFVNDEREDNAILSTVKRGDLVEIVRVEEEVVHDLKLGRLEKHGALIVGKRPVLIDGVVSVTLVY